MNLSDALKDAPLPHTGLAEILYLDGEVIADPDNTYFRLYPDSLNHRAYYLIRRADVTGSIHPWDAQELTAAEFVGQKRFRVPPLSSPFL